MTYIYKSIYKDIIKDLIEEKHALGFKYSTMEYKLKEIDLLAQKLDIKNIEITKEFVLKFIKPKPNETKVNSTNRVSAIRVLANYMIRKGYKAYIMPPLPRGSYNHNFVPYIFTDNELEKFFNACDSFDFEQFPTRKKYSLIFKILYSTGMRIGEVLNLKLKEINFNNNTFLIVNAKNNKDRQIPVHPIIIEYLKEYVANYKIFNDNDYVFANKFGTHIDISTVYDYFRKMLWKAGIHHGGKGKGPRVHSFRHTYCVHKLKEWVLEGKDITALFPYLCAYMGHSDTRCTEYYLRLTADLYPNIISKSENYFNGDNHE